VLRGYRRECIGEVWETAYSAVEIMKHLVRTSKNLGHAIREARKAKKLTQKELASMSGVWQETISKIEDIF